MKQYLVTLMVDESKKVHYLVRSTSKAKAADKSVNVQSLHSPANVSKIKIRK